MPVNSAADGRQTRIAAASDLSKSKVIGAENERALQCVIDSAIVNRKVFRPHRSRVLREAGNEYHHSFVASCGIVALLSTGGVLYAQAVRSQSKNMRAVVPVGQHNAVPAETVSGARSRQVRERAVPLERRTLNQDVLFLDRAHQRRPEVIPLEYDTLLAVEHEIVWQQQSVIVAGERELVATAPHDQPAAVAYVGDGVLKRSEHVARASVVDVLPVVEFF